MATGEGDKKRRTFSGVCCAQRRGQCLVIVVTDLRSADFGRARTCRRSTHDLEGVETRSADGRTALKRLSHFLPAAHRFAKDHFTST